MGASLLLARHGETDDNAAARFQGHRDPPLNERGRRQAGELAAAVQGEGIAALWSSPLRRAAQTAEIVAFALDLAPRFDDRLREVDVGDRAGRSYAEVLEHEPELFAAWRDGERSFRFPGGESLDEHVERVAAVLADIRAGGRLPALVICHGGVIRAARRAAGVDGVLSDAVANGSVHRL